MRRCFEIRKLGLAAAVIALVASCGNTGASSSDKHVTLEFATYATRGTLQAGKDVQRWADEVKKRTEGRVTIKIHYGNSLVDPAEVLDALDTGLADGASIIGGIFPDQFSSWVQLGTVHDLDRTLRWGPDKQNQLTRQMMTKFPVLERQLTDKKLELMMLHTAPMHNLQARAPITNLAQLRGKHIRTYGTGMPLMFKAAGAVPVDMPVTEVYTATQNKTVDGTFTALDPLEAMKYYEVAPHVTLLGEKGSTALMNFGLFSVLTERAWQQVSPGDRKILTDAGRSAEDWLADGYYDRQDQLLRDGKKKHGLRVHSFDEAGLASWREQLGSKPYEPAVKQLDDAGLQGSEMLREMLALADRIAKDGQSD